MIDFTKKHCFNPAPFKMDVTDISWFCQFLGDYLIRFGLTKEPMLWFLDPTKSIPILHFIINMLRFVVNLIAHLKAR